MPVPVSFPGVYIEEVPSGVHTITGVATSITAFIGRAPKGPVDEAVTITSNADYQRIFGGLSRSSTLSYAVRQFFQNGGSQAVIVRVVEAAADAATIELNGTNELAAASPGTWGRNLVATVEGAIKTKDPSDGALFNLIIFDDPARKLDVEGRGGSGARETFLNVSVDPASPRFVTNILEQQSQLVRVTNLDSTTVAPVPVIVAPFNYPAVAASGDDGGDITALEVEGDELLKTGIFALEKTDLFNLLCIPPLTAGATGDDVDLSTWTAAADYCEKRRAFLIVDAPSDWTVSNVGTAPITISNFSAIVRKNAALYFPRMLQADPLQENNLEVFAPSGLIAGLMSRIDSSRGVWKAPAGIEANLEGVVNLTINMTDKENGLLNPQGINCLRNFPGIGIVCWGARTLEGQDILASEWKYVPVRRLALFLEESLFRGTKWIVFEPNDEPLWAKIRLNLNAFMMSLFRQGAFQGSTLDKAFFVKCDAETTTQNDRNLGIVNIEVGFAPLKPAEFVIIKIQQIAGEL